jgi:beta-glucosidase
VLIKNQNKTLPIAKGKTVYVPKRVTPAGINFFGQPSPEKIEYPVNLDLLKKYYTVTDDPTKADFAMVFIKSPISGGYSRADREAGGNGYVPISLQLNDYTAVDAREHSIAAGDPVIDSTIKDRTYKGKTSKSNSYPDLNTILATKKAMNGKPVIVSVSITNPMVFGEFEKEVDAIVGEFGVQLEAQMDIISGKVEPSGLLPLQMPLNMSVVEKQFEDKPHDMTPYKDAQGHVYDFGFGLDWKGVIQDARTIKYAVKK